MAEIVARESNKPSALSRFARARHCSIVPEKRLGWKGEGKNEREIVRSEKRARSRFWNPPIHFVNDKTRFIKERSLDNCYRYWWTHAWRVDENNKEKKCIIREREIRRIWSPHSRLAHAWRTYESLSRWCRRMASAALHQHTWARAFAFSRPWKSCFFVQIASCPFARTTGRALACLQPYSLFNPKKLREKISKFKREDRFRIRASSDSLKFFVEFIW